MFVVAIHVMSLTVVTVICMKPIFLIVVSSAPVLKTQNGRWCNW